MRDYGRMSHFLEPKSKMSSIVNFDQELADLLQVEERLLFIINQGVGGHIVYYLIWRFCCLMLERVRRRIQHLRETKDILSDLL